jgi:hypothetical protein
MTALNAGFVATIADLGMEDRTANEIMGRAIPPKLMVATLICDAAMRQEINVTHLDAIMGAFYGNQLPASITQQKSKFKVFLDCGVKQAPAGAMIRRVAELIQAKRDTVAAMGAGKDRDREQKAADRYAAGIFEKGTSLARLQMKKGAVLLTDEEIATVMSPDAKVSDDPLADGLEALIKATEKLNGTSPFIGADAVLAALNAALQTHHAKAAVVTPESNAPVIEAAPTEVVVATPNNVVSIPAPKSTISLADSEIDDLVGGLVMAG